jgi:hypothetical protein
MADPEQVEVEQSVRETEDELLQGAFEPEPKGEVEPEAKGPARDPETGRFAPKAPAQAEPKGEAEAAPVEQPRKPEEEEILPSWRAREINEERRAAVAELERMRVEHARMQAYIAQQQRAQTPPAAEAPPPDPVIDTPGYTKWLEDKLRREFQQQQAVVQQQQAIDRLNYDLRFAHTTYGDRFEKAYEALVTEGQRGNRALVQHLTSQPSPGEAIMRWWTQSEVLREVGNDPSAYKQKTRDELLKDPEFLAQAVEAHRRLATGGGQPNAVVKLPPSLSKATGTSEVPQQTQTDGSEASIFAYAMQPNRRR